MTSQKGADLAPDYPFPEGTSEIPVVFEVLERDSRADDVTEGFRHLESGHAAMLRVSSEVKQAEANHPRPILDAATAGSETIALAAMQDAQDPPGMAEAPQGSEVAGRGSESEAELMTATPPCVEERREQEKSGPPDMDVSDASELVMESPHGGTAAGVDAERSSGGADREGERGFEHRASPTLSENGESSVSKRTSDKEGPEGKGSGKGSMSRSTSDNESGKGFVSRSTSDKGPEGKGSASRSTSGKEGGKGPVVEKVNSSNHKKRDLEKEAEELFRALPESVRQKVSHTELEQRLDEASKTEAGGSEKLDQQTGVLAKVVSGSGSASEKSMGGKSLHERSHSQGRLQAKVNESVQYLSESAKEVLEYAPRPLTPVVALFYRLCRDGSVESLTWNEAGEEEIQEILHYAKLCMGAYSLTPEDAVKDSEFVVKVESVHKLVTHNTDGKCPAHIIFLDHDRRDIVLAVRGLDMTSVDDFNILEDNYRGQQPYGDGYVHAGFYKAAMWLVENEGPVIKELVKKHPDYRLVMVGHSLGAGIAMTFTMLVTDDPDTVGGLKPEQIRCYGVAPPRCFSLGLSVKYAHVINSVVLQDDFLPRISTATVTAIFPLAGKTSCFCRFIVNYACWSLCKRCLRDTFVSQKALLQDPYRLYPPGRVYHVVHKHPCTCSCAKAPTKVKTDIPVKSRFERAVLTGSTFFDHNLTALIKVLKTELHVPEYRPVLQPPSVQKIQRASTMRREQGRALKQMADVQTMRKGKPQPKQPQVPKPPPPRKTPGIARQGSRRIIPRELEMLGSGLGQVPGEGRPAISEGPFSRSVLQRSMTAPHGSLDQGGDPPQGSVEAAAAAAVAKADSDKGLLTMRSLDSQPTPRSGRTLSLVQEEPEIERLAGLSTGNGSGKR